MQQGQVMVDCIRLSDAQVWSLRQPAEYRQSKSNDRTTERRARMRERDRVKALGQVAPDIQAQWEKEDAKVKAIHKAEDEIDRNFKNIKDGARIVDVFESGLYLVVHADHEEARENRLYCFNRATGLAQRPLDMHLLPWERTQENTTFDDTSIVYTTDGGNGRSTAVSIIDTVQFQETWAFYVNWIKGFPQRYTQQALNAHCKPEQRDCMDMSTVENDDDSFIVPDDDQEALRQYGEPVDLFVDARKRRAFTAEEWEYIGRPIIDTAGVEFSTLVQCNASYIFVLEQCLGHVVAIARRDLVGKNTRPPLIAFAGTQITVDRCMAMLHGCALTHQSNNMLVVDIYNAQLEATRRIADVISMPSSYALYLDRATDTCVVQTWPESCQYRLDPIVAQQPLDIGDEDIVMFPHVLSNTPHAFDSKMHYHMLGNIKMVSDAKYNTYNGAFISSAGTVYVWNDDDRRYQTGNLHQQWVPPSPARIVQDKFAELATTYTDRLRKMCKTMEKDIAAVAELMEPGMDRRLFRADVQRVVNMHRLMKQLVLPGGGQ